MLILVINSGSSSIKFQLFGAKDLKVVAKGLIERIGEADGVAHFTNVKSEERVKLKKHISCHKEAFELVSELFSNSGFHLDELIGIGHRVVHGGEHFSQPVIIDEKVISQLKRLIPLAPLHNPANVEGIEIAFKNAPNVPQVAVFDTAFHQTLPDYAFLYALPYDFYKKYKIRRYGFHGTSHSYVVKKAAQFLGISYEDISAISLHLGNGASVAAIQKGKCVDTSMGFTPLEGLIMGTRCGDIDASIPFYLNKEVGFNYFEIEKILNKESGLKGVCGENDMRVIIERAENGDKMAKVALEMFCYRIKKYIGAYMAALGKVDCIIFTGGIGEHSEVVRQKSLSGLECLGIQIDDKKNTKNFEQINNISSDTSKIQVLVIPTDEELEIAQQVLSAIKAT